MAPDGASRAVPVTMEEQWARVKAGFWLLSSIMIDATGGKLMLLRSGGCFIRVGHGADVTMFLFIPVPETLANQLDKDTLPKNRVEYGFDGEDHNSGILWMTILFI